MKKMFLAFSLCIAASSCFAKDIILELSGVKKEGTNPSLTYSPNGTATLTADCDGVTSTCAKATIHMPDSRATNNPETGDPVHIEAYDEQQNVIISADGLFVDQQTIPSSGYYTYSITLTNCIQN